MIWYGTPGALAGVPGGTTIFPVAVSSTGTGAPAGAPVTGVATPPGVTVKLTAAMVVVTPLMVSATEPVPVPVTTLPTLALPVAPLTAG